MIMVFKLTNIKQNQISGLIICFIIIFSSVKLLANTGSDRGIYQTMKSKKAEDIMDIGIDHLNRNSLDTALVCFSIVQQNFSDYKNDKEREYYLAGINGLGIVYFLFGNYSQSFLMFNKAIKTDPNYIDAYQNLASIYELFGKYNEAREQLHKAYTLQLNNGDFEHAITAFINIVNIDIQNEMINKSDSIIKVFEKFEFPERVPLASYAHILSKAAESLINNDGGKAIGYFKESLSQLDNIFMASRIEASTNMNIAKVFQMEGKPDSAAFYYKKAIEIAEHNSFEEIIISTGKELANLYDSMGEHDIAHIYRYRSLILADSIQNLSEFDKIKNFEFQYEAERYEKEIAESNARKNTQKIILFAVLIIMVILLVLLISLLRQRRILRMKDGKLFERLENRDYHPSLLSFEKSFQPIQYINSKNESEEVKSKAYKNRITPEHSERLMNAIQKIMNDESNFLVLDFSLSKLADLVNDSPKNVSQVINERVGKNFNTFYNEYRIGAAIKRMQQSKYDNYTIDAIADELGFKSRTTFSKTFTAITGMSPTTYRNLKRQNEHK